MDIKEKSRYVFIREKARTIKQKPKDKPVSINGQTQAVRAMKEQLIADKRREESESTATEQVEQLAQSVVSYYGEKTFFTVKNISLFQLLLLLICQQPFKHVDLCPLLGIFLLKCSYLLPQAYYG